MTIPHSRFTDAHGTIYEPWTDGYALGFRVTDSKARVSYVYLNPSSEDSEGKSNTFLYIGLTGDPGLDTPECWVASVPEAHNGE